MGRSHQPYVVTLLNTLMVDFTLIHTCGVVLKTAARLMEESENWSKSLCMNVVCVFNCLLGAMLGGCDGVTGYL